MYRNIQQETWKVWYMTTEKDLTVLAKYPLLPGQSFKTRWVAIGNIETEGRQTLLCKLQDWTKFRRRFPKENCPVQFPLAQVYFSTHLFLEP